MKEVKVGQIYRHFKGNEYIIIAIAYNTENLEKMVVYKHDDEVWVRPYDMFISKVDKTKYPDVKQEYRFELIKDV